MNDVERQRHIERILDAGVPDWRERAQRYDAYPISLRLLDVEDQLLVKAQVPNVADRELLLRAIHAKLGARTPVRFTP